MVLLNPRHAFVALGLLAVPALAQVTATASGIASGQGTLDQGRKFALGVRINADGTAFGQATLVNKNFTGDTANQPYQLHVTVTCGKKLDDQTAIFGGMTQKTSDSNLVDAVTFSVQDNGEPGAAKDMISRAYFFDDNPATTADPKLCLGSTLADVPLETIVSGNIQVR